MRIVLKVVAASLGEISDCPGMSGSLKPRMYLDWLGRVAAKLAMLFLPHSMGTKASSEESRDLSASMGDVDHE